MVEVQDYKRAPDVGLKRISFAHIKLDGLLLHEHQDGDIFVYVDIS